MRKISLYISIISLLIILLAHPFKMTAQTDTIKIMSYNTLNYDDYDASCPTNINALKNRYLREIVKYVNPDILGLVKMNQDPAFVNDSIPSEVLDSVCNGCWAHGIFTDYSKYSKGNQLYFKTSKFGFIGTKTIYSADASISDINMHELYYKDTALARTHDTIFLNIILVHDLSGGSSASQRATEIGGAMAWLDANVKKPGNYIFMGDFNVTSSGEGCFQAMLNPTNPIVKFNEPTGQLGNWSSNSASFAKYITQSTRTATLTDCGSSGGLTDWFDHIMCSDYIMGGTDAFTYVPNSFAVVAQDGKHTKNSLIASPTDVIAPSNIVNDVYHMSNHMPVSLNLAINPQHRVSGISNQAVDQSLNNVNCHYFNNKLDFSTLDESLWGRNCTVTLYDCLGKRILNTSLTLENNSSNIDVSFLPKGCYIVILQSGNQLIARNKVVKM